MAMGGFVAGCGACTSGLIAVKPAHLVGLLATALAAALAGCSGSAARTSQPAARPAVQTMRMKFPAGAADVDVYMPDTAGPAPLVIVAHGFSRHRNTMSAWGRHLAKEGFVAVVPDLPAWSNQVRNGRFITELRAYLCADESWRQRVDPSRVGLMGFSAGGLATLLSAADEPGPAIWVGLDPVDRDGIGAKAAPLVTCRAVALTAEPSVCNSQGNARGIIAALPHGQHFMVAGAVHVDAEWPTDWVAEAVCGRSTDEKRSEFRRRATMALREALSMPAVDSLPVLIEEARDPRR